MQRSPIGYRVDAPMYYLSKDSYVCATQDYWIVLNALKDKYHCISSADLSSIEPWLHQSNGPFPDNTRVTQAPSPAKELLDALVKTGIVTARAEDGKEFGSINCSAPTDSLEGTQLSQVQHASLWRHLKDVLSACLAVDLSIATSRLVNILARVERRRQQNRQPANEFDFSKTATLLAAFRSLRPIYPRRHVCLFDSLALLNFLARYQLYPQIVFGVVADPFQAHCWVQEASTAINDDPDLLSKYTPILVK